MATIYDVSKLAQVSTATVSAVVNNSSYVSPPLKKRVREAIKELNYRPNHLARSLYKGSTHTVGMLIPHFANPDPFFAQAVRGAEDVLRKRNYVLILGQTYNRVEEQSRYIAAFHSRLVDGLLLFLSDGDDPELAEFLREGKPVVYRRA